jgi:hypothetical protein
MTRPWKELLEMAIDEISDWFSELPEECRDIRAPDLARGFTWQVYETHLGYRVVATQRGLSTEQLRELVHAAVPMGYGIDSICPHCERSLADCYILTIPHPRTGLHPPLAYHSCLTQDEARALVADYHARGFPRSMLYSETPLDAEDIVGGPYPECPECGSHACRPGGGHMCGARAELVPGGEVPF